MTDYNDGNWHGWNGGECPVHLKSDVEVISGIEVDGKRNVHHRNAGALVWDCIIAFRVAKAYREPREFWLVCGPMGRRWVHDTAPSTMQSDHTLIHVREVRDDA